MLCSGEADVLKGHVPTVARSASSGIAGGSTATATTSWYVGVRRAARGCSECREVSVHRWVVYAAVALDDFRLVGR